MCPAKHSVHSPFISKHLKHPLIQLKQRFWFLPDQNQLSSGQFFLQKLSSVISYPSEHSTHFPVKFWHLKHPSPFTEHFSQVNIFRTGLLNFTNSFGWHLGTQRVSLNRIMSLVQPVQAPEISSQVMQFSTSELHSLHLLIYFPPQY